MLTPEDRHQIAQERELLVRRIHRLDLFLETPGHHARTDEIVREQRDALRDDLNMLDLSVECESVPPRSLTLLPGRKLRVLR